MPSTMPTSESRLLKEYMVDGEGLVPGFTLIQERELWEIIGTGVGIDFTVGLFVSGDNLVNHIQGKAVNSEEEDQEGPGDHFIFGLEKRLSNARIGDQKNNSIRAGGKKKHRPFKCRTLVFGISMIPCHFDRKTQVRASSVVGDRFLCGLYCPPSSSQLNRPRVHRKKRRRFSIFIPEVPQPPFFSTALLGHPRADRRRAGRASSTELSPEEKGADRPSRSTSPAVRAPKSGVKDMAPLSSALL